ncbi:5-oxoprolinase subunit PxpB [Flavobacteriaceae bacterium]|nr:5-oxoprolinase subunit PxpB [Flavobacteriaceae bacterium]MDC3369025.1 5-oxoprolinase subunit PxpB [Flavobacteriaceae bacterium]
MNNKLPFTFFRMHPKVILLEWEQDPSPETLKELNHFKANILKYSIGVSQITQGYCSLLVQWKEDIINYSDTKKDLIALYSNLNINSTSAKIKHWTLPVCYEGEFALDLEHLSSELKLSKDTIIELHSKTIYTVCFIGFLPGFLYLDGLDSKLFFPRKKNPRLVIPKGAVAIGGKQTGIYPNESPGGWHIIGNTPISLFNIKNETPCFATSGDTLSFYAVDEAEYQKIRCIKNSKAYLTKVK